MLRTGNTCLIPLRFLDDIPAKLCSHRMLRVAFENVNRTKHTHRHTQLLRIASPSTITCYIATTLHSFRGRVERIAGSMSLRLECNCPMSERVLSSSLPSEPAQVTIAGASRIIASCSRKSSRWTSLHLRRAHTQSSPRGICRDSGRDPEASSASPTWPEHRATFIPNQRSSVKPIDNST